MFTPPEEFRQLRSLTFAVPVLVFMGTGFLLWTHGARPAQMVLGMAGVIALGAALMVQPVIWASPWGWRFVMGTALGLHLLFVLPWACMLLPLMAPRPADAWVLSAAVSAVLTALLVLSAWWHGRKAGIEGWDRKKSLRWDGCRVDLRKRHIDKLQDAQGEAAGAKRWLSPALVGGLSVVSYQVLKASLPERGLVLFATLLALAGGLWLCIGPLAKALGQAWRLRQLERLTGGAPFSTARLDWLTRERLRHARGRWWSRAFNTRD